MKGSPEKPDLQEQGCSKLSNWHSAFTPHFAGQDSCFENFFVMAWAMNWKEGKDNNEEMINAFYLTIIP